MKESFFDYYRNKSFVAPFHFLGNYFIEKNPRKRLALWKRVLDYTSILKARGDGLLEYHREINQILLEQSKDYPHYDYGEGYFYQSFPRAHVSGFRNTADRINQLGLKEITRDKSVLDIGCNAGFLLLSLADSYSRGFGFDLNPYLIQIANATKSFLGVENTKFSATSFEDLEYQETYDVVLSLANHSTYDQNTKQDVESYFKKVFLALNKDGVLVFESHPPAIEDKDKLDKSISAIKRVLCIEEVKQLPLRGFLDKDRTYVIARKTEN